MSNIITAEVEASSPCHPSPCGVSASCRVVSGRPVCSCLPGLQGDPAKLCLPQCLTNSQCGQEEACVRHECVDPCSGNVCGLHASCRVVLHNPICSCDQGHVGDPYTHCQPFSCKRVNLVYSLTCIHFLLFLHNLYLHATFLFFSCGVCVMAWFVCAHGNVYQKCCLVCR